MQKKRKLENAVLFSSMRRFLNSAASTPETNEECELHRHSTPPECSSANSIPDVSTPISPKNALYSRKISTIDI